MTDRPTDRPTDITVSRALMELKIYYKNNVEGTYAHPCEMEDRTKKLNFQNFNYFFKI